MSKSGVVRFDGDTFEPASPERQQHFGRHEYGFRTGDVLIAGFGSDHIFAVFNGFGFNFGQLGGCLIGEDDGRYGLAVEVWVIVQPFIAENADKGDLGAPCCERIAFGVERVCSQLVRHAFGQHDDITFAFLEPAAFDQNAIKSTDLWFEVGKTDQPTSLCGFVAKGDRDERCAGFVCRETCVIPCTGSDNALSGKGCFHHRQGFCGDILPVEIFEHQAGVRGLVAELCPPCLSHGFDRGEVHDGEGKDNQCGKGQERAYRTAFQVAHTEHKGRTECSGRADSSQLDMG